MIAPNFLRSVVRFTAIPWKLTPPLMARPIEAIFLPETQTPGFPSILPARRPKRERALIVASSSAVTSFLASSPHPERASTG